MVQNVCAGVTGKASRMLRTATVFGLLHLFLESVGKGGEKDDNAEIFKNEFE